MTIDDEQLLALYRRNLISSLGRSVRELLDGNTLRNGVLDRLFTGCQCLDQFGFDFVDGTVRVDCGVERPLARRCQRRTGTPTGFHRVDEFLATH